jgi:hypothetical protein
MLQRLVATLALLTLPALADAAVSVVHVWPSHRTADSFRRISEYIDGTENTGHETVLRTQPAERTGCYFLTRIKTDTPVVGATLVLEVVLPGNPAIRTFQFPAEFGRGNKVFQVGVTGSDWPDTQMRPSAWRVTIRSSDGTVLADSPSFLWQMPHAK